MLEHGVVLPSSGPKYVIRAEDEVYDCYLDRQLSISHNNAVMMLED